MKPYLENEARDRDRVLEEVMRLLAEGTLPVHSGARTSGNSKDGAIMPPSAPLYMLHAAGHGA